MGWQVFYFNLFILKEVVLSVYIALVAQDATLTI